ncbi:hypothetical protein [Agromyces albus]|uniref:hypothetical protein n=1 Tax=Agromyces albus TaxID=205332 RepID=UPI0027854D87|nr:hypothetical protein [Agromyces albus]MDQ0576976.1 hypothetical protein [Agromyces albus]
MKHYAIVLKGFSRFNGEVEHVQRRNGRSTSHFIFERKIIVFTAILLLGGVSAAAISASIFNTVRDGYRRLPKETFARTV